MGQIIPFITVDNAVEAVAFYEDVFGAKVQGEITWLENVPGMDKEVHVGKIGHCSMKIGESVIFIKDALEEYPLTPGDRIQMVLDLDSEEVLRTAFDKLKKEGKVVHEIQEVFWGASFAQVKDKYEVTWQIYYGHK